MPKVNQAVYIVLRFCHHSFKISNVNDCLFLYLPSITDPLDVKDNVAVPRQISGPVVWSVWRRGPGDDNAAALRGKHGVCVPGPRVPQRVFHLHLQEAP